MKFDTVFDRIYRDDIAILNQSYGAADLSLWYDMANTKAMRPISTSQIDRRNG